MKLEPCQKCKYIEISERCETCCPYLHYNTKDVRAWAKEKFNSLQDAISPSDKIRNNKLFNQILEEFFELSHGCIGLKGNAGSPSLELAKE